MKRNKSNNNNLWRSTPQEHVFSLLPPPPLVAPHFSRLFQTNRPQFLEPKHNPSHRPQWLLSGSSERFLRSSRPAVARMTPQRSPRPWSHPFLVINSHHHPPKHLPKLYPKKSTSSSLVTVFALARTLHRRLPKRSARTFRMRRPSKNPELLSLALRFDRVMQLVITKTSFLGQML